MKVPSLLRIAAAAVLTGIAGSAWAQDYPTRPIRIVLPFAAGSPTDAMLRILTEPLAKRLGQGVVVENKAGATGMVGTASAAQSPPDGYTLLFGTNTTQVANKYFFKTISYDGVKDFAPIAVVGGVPHVLVVPPSMNVGTAQELIDYAKRNPGKLNYPYANSTTRITAATFRVMTGTSIEEVPYRAYGQAVTDLVAGRVQMMFIDFTTGLPQIEAGHLKALAITPNRSPRLPGVPAMKEVLPGFEIGNWNGLFAPVGTPAPIVERLHREMTAILEMPQVRKQIETIGYELLPKMSPDEFRDYIARESVEYGRLVKNAGIEPE